MSYLEFAKGLLDILDLNLILHKDVFHGKRINDEACFVFDTALTYQPEECFHHHYQNKQTIIRWDWRRASILLDDVSNYKTILRTNKQRFECEHCGKTFLAEDPVSDRCCSITRRIRQAIFELLNESASISLIARMKHIFPTTVIQILRSLRPKTVFLSRLLPEMVYSDEFKSVKNVSRVISFVMVGGRTHQLINIMGNRQLNPLRDYLLRCPREIREQMRPVAPDSYTPYRTLMKECFPNARIVADRSHISQHIGRAFTNHRIQVMKTFKEGDRRSKYLKKYWKLLQKDAWELNGQHRYWRPLFRDHLTEAEIVDRLLSYDDSLKRGYGVYQDFLSVIRRQDVPKFITLLKEDYKELPEYHQPVFTTFKKYQTEIKRALRVPYSNDPIECLSNRVKVLKRIVYGFRNFQDYRERIFLYRGKYFKKTKNTTQLTKARTTTRLDKIVV